MRGGFLRETPLITGKLTGSYGEGLYQNWAGISAFAVDQKRSFFPRVGPFLDLLPCKGFFPLTGALTGRPPYGKAPYGEASYRKASSGRFLTGDTFNYRKAYGKLRGGILPELGGNFRLCAVDQKRSFFPRVGPFLDLLPCKGFFPLTGALTGRPPYGKAPYGEASYRKASSGRFLTGDTFNYRKAYGKLRGGTLPELGGNFRFCRRPKEAVFS